MLIITFEEITQINAKLSTIGFPCKVAVYDRPEGQECHLIFPPDASFDQLIRATNEVENYFRMRGKPVRFSGNGKRFYLV